jgi:hypothetical protein
MTVTAAGCACHRTVEDFVERGGLFDCPVACDVKAQVPGGIRRCEPCSRDFEAGKPWTGCPHKG